MANIPIMTAEAAWTQPARIVAS